MNCVLRLQTLQPNTNATPHDVVFMSGISIVCPLTVPGKGVFEME